MDKYKRIVFFTGAGISVESGIPTYRGAGGVWKDYDYRDYACQEAFLRDPEKVWDFHDQRRVMIKGCEPNPAHRIIAKIQHQQPDTCIITQNIDGLHQRAGARRVIELHGSIWRLRAPKKGSTVENFETPLQERKCGADGWWRPDIIWFGDSLNQETIDTALSALKKCDLLICIGTSAVVYPAARMPEIAINNGAETIEINPEKTPISHLFQRCLRDSASSALGSLFPEFAEN
ncbi:MAG: NAD-dependent deacylase [Deltaproteobacteria bacterium]|nr:NAD-dependent deacylase [Deltaproteobacteria bacterium]